MKENITSNVTIIETEYGNIKYIKRPRKSTKEDEKAFYKFLTNLIIRNENYVIKT